MTIELPDVNIGSQPLTSGQARIELACALYAAWKISMSQAVKIAGMPRILFWEELGKRKIPRQYGVEDFEHDMRVLEELAAKKSRRMIVVSDTSPITTLIQIGKVDLLHKLYGEVLIPEAVRAELSASHQSLPEFFQCVPAANRGEVKRLSAELDLGEAEAIVLAKEQHADLLLIDENDGRNVATREGLRFIGLISVLVESKLEGFIPSLRDVLREIENKTTFYISLEIKNLALKRAGEL